MELVELGPLSEEQRRELEGDEVNPFGTLGSDLKWRPKDHHVALRGPDGRLGAAAGWLLVEVDVAGTVMPVVGIGGVIVAKPLRGTGLGRRVIAEAIDRAEALGPEIAMLFCQDDRVALYQRHGFALVEPPVLADQPGGPVEVPLEVMWRPLWYGAALALGPVRIPGLPF